MKATLYSSDLKRLVDATKKFTRQDGTNMQYIQIAVDKENNTITATALDGRRVSIEKATSIDCDKSFECLIKPALLPYRANEYAIIEKIDDKTYITIGDNIIGYRQPAGEYYDTDQVMRLVKDTEVIQTIAVDARLLKEALESVKTTGRPCVAIDIPKDVKGVIVIRHKGNKKIVLPVDMRNDDN